MTFDSTDEKYKQIEEDLDKKLKSINRNYLLAMGAVALVVLAGLVGAAL